MYNLCLNKSSDYNLILNFFHKPWIIFVVTVCVNLQFFNKSFTNTSGTMQQITYLEILKRHCRLTYESPLSKKRSVSAILSWTEMAFLNTVSFFDIQILCETFWCNSYITHWPNENSSLPTNLNRCALPFMCTAAFATTAALLSFSLKRNVHKCTKPLLAAKTSLGLP
jgi:hypothetical protein